MTDNIVPFPERRIGACDPALPLEQQDHAAIFAHRALVSIVRPGGEVDFRATYDAFRALFVRAMAGLPVEDPPEGGYMRGA